MLTVSLHYAPYLVAMLFFTLLYRMVPNTRVLVPLSEAYDVRGLARALAMPLVIAARPGLGTINHTLLTLEAATLAGPAVAAVVFTPWPSDPGRIEESNRETVARLGNVEVATLARVERAQPEYLSRAGRSLPIAQWLDGAR